MMDKLSQLWRRLLFYARRDRFDRELEEEMRFHLEMKAQENAEAGMEPLEARYAAHRQFGNQTLLREVSRDMWGFRTLEALAKDLRYGLRMMIKNPGFTVVAVISLALGIGANTAIFSIVNSVLLRPLPYPSAERLMTIWEDHRARNGPEREWTSPPGFEDWRDQAKSFDHVVAVQFWQPTLTGQGEPERLTGAQVSHDTFAMLGVAPALGRSFRPEEDRPGVESVVIISHGLWRKRFGADPSLVGRRILLNGESRAVIGVMPAGFKFPIIADADVWRPIQPVINSGCRRGCTAIRVMARLKPDATEAQARAELNAIAARIEQQFPDTNTKVGATLVPLQEFLVGPVKAQMLALLVAVAFVLLIVCANVANLLLARSATREKEIAVRASLGAGRWRIARQLLSESLLLAVIGGTIGLLLAYGLVDLLASFSPQGTPRVDEIGVDGRALGYALAVTVLTGLLFGAAPVWQLFKADLNQSLRDSGKGLYGARSGRRALGALVVVETALALTLLVGAGLLVKSFIRLQRVDPGFDPRNMLTAVVTLPQAAYPERNQVALFYNRLLERARTLPGAQSAAVVSSLPLTGFDSDAGFVIEGRPAPRQDQQSVAWVSSVSPGYFRTMGMGLIAGREFTDRDNENSPKVVIISEETARRHFPNENPIGKRIGDGSPDGWREIVGVTADVKHFGLNQDSRVSMFFPDRQQLSRRMFIVVRTAADPSSLSPALRGVVAEMDRNLAVSNIIPMEEISTRSIGQERFTLLLLGLFSALALLLAVAGIYGVMSYAVAQRTHEIGLRMALGAQTGAILKLVVRRGVKLVAGGVALGLVASFSLTRLMAKMLFGVSAADPLTFIVITLLLAFVALLACWIPARRAAKVDPMTALRFE
jgi:predicted permease